MTLSDIIESIKYKYAPKGERSYGLEQGTNTGASGRNEDGCEHNDGTGGDLHEMRHPAGRDSEGVAGE